MPTKREKPGPCHFCGIDAKSNFWMREVHGDKRTPLVSYCDGCANKDVQELKELRTRRCSMLSMMED